jgi:hypothetical protein
MLVAARSGVRAEPIFMVFDTICTVGVKNGICSTRDIERIMGDRLSTYNSIYRYLRFLLLSPPNT